VLLADRDAEPALTALGLLHVPPQLAAAVVRGGRPRRSSASLGHRRLEELLLGVVSMSKAIEWALGPDLTGQNFLLRRPE
jgi:hypothetical protein